MEYRKMGRTGLKVSSFCLGTMTFGRQVEENLSIRIIHAALDAGVNFIDTADMYVNGVTEEIVGKAIKGQRDQVVLAWILSNKTITSVVCGSTSIEQLQENMAAADMTVPKEALDACDQVWHRLRPPRLFYGR